MSSMVRAPLMALMAAVLVACGAEDGAAPPHGDLPQCEAPEVALPDGSCIRPGVPPNGCGEGFVHDGDVGCEPLLPAEPCPEGWMAVPGETECHPVMECGDGTWGDIPVDGTTIYVDAAYASGSSDGSAAAPFTTIAAALGAASDGDLIAVAAGTYAENVLVHQRVRLWGVCPERAIIAGAGATAAALDFRTGAQGAEAHGFAITGSNPVGVSIWGVEDVLLTHLWVHEPAGRGLNLQATLGPTSVTVQHTLVEGSHDIGVFVYGSAATLDGVVVRDTLPLQSDPPRGRGISIQLDPDTSSTATITASLVERNHEFGIFVSGSTATLDGVVVRDTFPQPSDLSVGRGIHVQGAIDTGAPSVASITATVVERSHDIGVVIQGSEATLDAVVVRDTFPQQSDLRFGRGIDIETSRYTGAPSTATVTASLVERSHDIGIYASGSEATLENVVVRDTFPRQSDLGLGRGINIQTATGTPSTATITTSLVERSHDIGVLISGSEVTLRGVAIRQTRGRACDGLFGDGLVVVSESGPATAAITNSLVQDSDRAGLGNFGAHVGLGATVLTCNAFDLASETFLDQPFAFDDLGQNSCGCPEPSEACKAISAGLEPPGSIDDSP